MAEQPLSNRIGRSMIWTLATRMGFASEQWKTGGLARTPRVYPVPKEIVNDTTLTIAPCA